MTEESSLRQNLLNEGHRWTEWFIVRNGFDEISCTDSYCYRTLLVRHLCYKLEALTLILLKIILSFKIPYLFQQPCIHINPGLQNCSTPLFKHGYTNLSKIFKELLIKNLSELQTLKILVASIINKMPFLLPFGCSRSNYLNLSELLKIWKLTNIIGNICFYTSSSFLKMLTAFTKTYIYCVSFFFISNSFILSASLSPSAMVNLWISSSG